MSLFNSFIHSDKLTDFLIEGHNPDARLKLTHADVDALRQQMQTGEMFRAYVTGRVVMSGPGVWALTEQHLLIRDAAKRSVIRIETRLIDRFESVLGRYGHTVRLHTQGRQYSMYGVDVELAMSMHHELQSLGVKSSFEDKPARSRIWTSYSGPHLSALDCLADARQRLSAT